MKEKAESDDENRSSVTSNPVNVSNTMKTVIVSFSIVLPFVVPYAFSACQVVKCSKYRICVILVERIGRRARQEYLYVAWQRVVKGLPKPFSVVQSPTHIVRHKRPTNISDQFNYSHFVFHCLTFSFLRVNLQTLQVLLTHYLGA